VLFDWFAKFILAEPVTLTAPAKADVVISEVAKAVKPTFFLNCSY
jgi:hypothetical protein